jgi:ABC-2 type transport system permease protein
VKPYLAIVGARLRTLLQYRAAAAAAGIATRLFWGLIRMMIFQAFYLSSAAPQPMSYRDVVTYVWLGQALLALMLGGADADVRAMVRTGTVAYEMVRPLDVYWVWYSRTVAARAAPTLLQVAPVFAAGALLGMQAPPSLASALAWVAGTLGALLLTSALWTLMSISLLWTVSGEGVSRLVPTLGYCFSGMLIPIPLLPDAVQPLVKALPFWTIMDAPFRLYLGHIPAAEAGAVLAHQLLWTAALVLLGQVCLRRAFRRLVVQGG